MLLLFILLLLLTVTFSLLLIFPIKVMARRKVVMATVSKIAPLISMTFENLLVNFELKFSFLNFELFCKLTDGFKSFIPKRILQDMVSAEHPFGALAIPTLAKAAGIVHFDPQYYFVPDDPALGFYRPTFANKICLLEKFDPTPEHIKTISTSKLIDALLFDNKK